MKTRRSFLALAAIALFLAMGSQARANDKVVSTVTAGSGPTPIITNEGASSGVIRLTYTWVASACTTGQFATFNLALSDQTGSGQSGTYPSTLTLADSGLGTSVQLSPAPGIFPISGSGWSNTSLVTVNIANCPTDFTDGTTLDGQLNESTPNGSHLDTITSVQVHIIVASPTTCLKLYSFETEQDGSTVLTSVDVVENNSGSVKSTNPGQVSVNGLVANTCNDSEQFDLLVTLDPNWVTNPSGNPGNATFTYLTTGEVDPSTFNLSAFGTGTAKGTNLCLTNVSLPGGDSFLTTVHSGIASGLSGSSLPSDNDFDFSVTLFQANSSCGTSIGSGVVSPSNPATSTIGYSVK